jgi:hypothetical protein
LLRKPSCSGGLIEQCAPNAKADVLLDQHLLNKWASSASAMHGFWAAGTNRTVGVPRAEIARCPL